jgi:pantoate--beta-alanine ligase
MFAYSSSELKTVLSAARDAGKKIGFVPTMGALHAGHQSLIKLAREAADFVVVSIFVNPLQFGDSADFEKYPRNLALDAGVLGEGEVDLLFAPDVKSVYPDGVIIPQLSAGSLGEVFEGAHRPGHFDGMLTVVSRLFDMVQPDVAVFGEKDAQQLFLVRRMVAQQLRAGVRPPLKIIGGPTIRESSGLALSSRNQFLRPDELPAALSLHRALEAVLAELAAGHKPSQALSAGRAQLNPEAKLDYLELVSIDSFETIDDSFEGPASAIIAARVGEVRLIDNEPVLIGGSAERMP